MTEPPPRSLVEHFVRSVYEGAAFGLAALGCLALVGAVTLLALLAFLLTQVFG